MVEQHREVAVSRGLSFVFTVMTWVTIAPAVGIGLGLTALFALSRGVTMEQLIPIAVFGAVAMMLCGIPGTMLWRSQFHRRVLTPLRDLGAVMITAGAGDLTARSNVATGDEIEVLAGECNNLISSLADIASNVRRSAESVSAAAAELSASSQEINSSTMEISSSVQQIARGAELQSRKVEETSASVESITSTTATVSAQIQEASRTSEEAARVATKGEEATDQAIAKIGEVRSRCRSKCSATEAPRSARSSTSSRPSPIRRISCP
jgi:methyl-accepting chemotaxis protein